MKIAYSPPRVLTAHDILGVDGKSVTLIGEAKKAA